jgi:hypothetical protein
MKEFRFTRAMLAGILVACAILAYFYARPEPMPYYVGWCAGMLTMMGVEALVRAIYYG